MHHRQRGLSLIWVAIGMAGLAAAAMAALFSMRYGRNFFAEGVDKAVKQSGAAAVVQQAAPAAAPLRRCVIDGKTVISDTECSNSNPTSKTITVHQTRGIESPKVRKPDPADATPQSMQDKMIEKATR
ncbi:MAG: DUF4124 domain-containing protein [Pseudomonadota bacterium]